METYKILVPFCFWSFYFISVRGMVMVAIFNLKKKKADCFCHSPIRAKELSGLGLVFLVPELDSSLSAERYSIFLLKRRWHSIMNTPRKNSTKVFTFFAESLGSWENKFKWTVHCTRFDTQLVNYKNKIDPCLDKESVAKRVLTTDTKRCSSYHRTNCPLLSLYFSYVIILERRY